MVLRNKVLARILIDVRCCSIEIARLGLSGGLVGYRAYRSSGKIPVNQPVAKATIHALPTLRYESVDKDLD